MMEVFFPNSLDELWAIMSANPGGAVMAGGTDLLVRIRKTGRKPPALFCLERIDELKQIRENEKVIFIGAYVTHQRLLENLTVQKRLRALWDAVSVLGSPPVRHSGTIGGNLCTASPAGDTLPPLYVFGAEVDIRSKSNKRSVSVAEFITGPGRTSLHSGEIVTRVSIPLPAPGTISRYYKAGKRKAMAITVASMAVQAKKDENGIIELIKLAWGSAGATVVTLPEAEEFLRGHTLSEERLRQAGKLVSAGVTPIDDIRGSAAYRRMVAGNLLLRLAHEN